MRFFFFAMLASSTLLTSCHFFVGERVSGNGHVVSRQKETGNFSGVEVSGSVKVHVRQESSASVKIETDENLLDFIEVFTEGNTLVIRTKQGYNLDPSKDIIAYVSAPEFKKLEISGQCDIVSDSPLSGNDELGLELSGQGDIQLEVNYPKIRSEISGQGSISLKGQATDFDAHVSGQGDVKCFELVTDNTQLDLSGASDVEVTANKQLDIEASGASTVHYKGNANVNQRTSGASSIKKVG
jgi:hypothetical protein